MTRRHPWIVLLVFLIFFVISFLTNILGPLVPDIINSFRLSLALAGFLPFSFFVAYGVMSIPAGMLLERFREKPVLVAAFALAFGGSLLFASVPRFPVALTSLFLIGIGMTLLQVAINPLLRVAGGEEHFAFLSVAAQLVFGLAFVSLLVGWLGDHVGLRTGMTVLYLTLGYILAIGFWARPLVDNATVSLKELLSGAVVRGQERGR